MCEASNAKFVDIHETPSVILLVATYNGAHNFELWSEWIYRLNPAPDLLVFLENNSTDGTLDNIKSFKLPHEIIRIWMREDLGEHLKVTWEYEHIAHIRQLLLTRAKKLNPDYAIFMDDDTLPPHDMIAKFLETKKDIVGGVYYRAFPEGVFLATKFYHHDEKFRKRGNYLLAQLESIREATSKTEYYISKKLFSDDGNIVEVPMTSGGCLCLSRRAIQHPQLYFYPHPVKEFTDVPSSEDFGYCMRARRMGIKTYVDLRILCRHLFDVRKMPRAWAVETYQTPYCLVDQKRPVYYKWR